MQVDVVRTWRALYPKLIFFAIPNGDYRTYRAGSRLKAEGVMPGVPDLHAAEVREPFHGLWVELKQPSNRPTITQYSILVALREQGYFACWCDSCEDATDVLIKYMKGRGLSLLPKE